MMQTMNKKGAAADLTAGAAGYRSKKVNSLSYILISLGGTASYLVFFADPDGWAKTMLGNGTDSPISIPCALREPPGSLSSCWRAPFWPRPSAPLWAAKC